MGRASMQVHMGLVLGGCVRAPVPVCESVNAPLKVFHDGHHYVTAQPGCKKFQLISVSCFSGCCSLPGPQTACRLSSTFAESLARELEFDALICLSHWCVAIEFGLSLHMSCGFGMVMSHLGTGSGAGCRQQTFVTFKLI